MDVVPVFGSPAHIIFMLEKLPVKTERMIYYLKCKEDHSVKDATVAAAKRKPETEIQACRNSSAITN